MLKALGIKKKVKDFYDADIIDVVRKRFKWENYDDGNVETEINRLTYVFFM